jgi:hypothetical protein
MSPSPEKRRPGSPKIPPVHLMVQLRLAGDIVVEVHCAWLEGVYINIYVLKYGSSIVPLHLCAIVRES